jgi:hypothetical protein
MLSSNMLLPNLIPLIDVTFSTPTPCFRQLEYYTLKSVFITTGSGWSSGPSTITLRPGFPGL